MLARNRELRRAVMAWAVLAAAMTLAGWRLAGTSGAAIALGSGFAAALPFLVLTWYRYRKLSQLSTRIDAVLHGERTLDLDHMDEGELAILASELEKMTMRFTLTADDLARERQSLADALADISHQLKTPLTSLSLTTELVRKSLAARPDCAAEIARLRRIERLQRRVEELVAALLKLARLDAGTLRLARADVSVAKLVDRAAEPLAIAYDIAGVELVREIAPDAHFTGDLAWTAEALGNILKNCMEHTPAGGTVTVRANEDLLACRITVEDTGGGIADEDLPHIFERFYRGRDAAGPSEVDPAGVGIGLSLAQALVVAQGGTLTAANARDAQGAVTGARFTLAFFKNQTI